MIATTPSSVYQMTSFFLACLFNKFVNFLKAKCKTPNIFIPLATSLPQRPGKDARLMRGLSLYLCLPCSPEKELQCLWCHQHLLRSHCCPSLVSTTSQPWLLYPLTTFVLVIIQRGKIWLVYLFNTDNFFALWAMPSHPSPFVDQDDNSLGWQADTGVSDSICK